MGYYTKFEFNIVLSNDIPNDVFAFISQEIGDPDFELFELPVPEHQFFRLPRWDQIFMPFQDGPEPRLTKENGYWKLYLAGEINYGATEIIQFSKWISPYIAGRKKKQYIGWFQGECMSERANFYANRI